jgi:hypothetical protein
MSTGSKVLPPPLSLLLGRTPLLVSRTLALMIASHPYTVFDSDGNEGSGKENQMLSVGNGLRACDGLRACTVMTGKRANRRACMRAGG